MYVDPQFLGLLAVTAVELVRHLLVELDPDLATSRHLDERGSLRATCRQAPERPRPLRRVVGGDQANLDHAVVRSRGTEHLDAAE